VVNILALAVMVPAPAQPINGDQRAPSAAVVRVPFPQDDGSLTPYTFELGHSLMTLVYDTLLWRDQEGVPRPWLAREVQTAADGRRLTVELVEGARWHDGEPVTAADVAFTFEYVASQTHPRFTGELRAVERVRATGANTVVIDLRHPSPGFLDQPLADLPILPRHLWQGLARESVPGGLPVGSGPYRLVEYQKGGGYRFQANPEYFRGAPAVEAIHVPFMSNAEETFRAVERREVDMIPLTLTEDLAASLESFGVRVVRGVSYVGTVLLFNVRTPPFDRLEVRRAVAQALDLERVARNVTRAVPADRGYLHPDSPFAPSGVLHTTDLDGARTVLASLGAPIEVLAPDSDPARMEAGRQVVLALQRAGATAELQLVPRAELSRAVGEDGSAPTFRAAIWSAPPLASRDPDFLRRLFGSTPADAPFNYGGYRSTEFDALADRIAATVDVGERRAVVEAALRTINADAPVVPLFFPEAAFAYRPAIYDGWVFVKGTGILDKRSFVEPAARAAAAARGGDLGTESPSGAGAGSGRLPLTVLAVALAGLAAGLTVVGVVVGKRRNR
jgi:peptide/nickel transport system substrate-binding protein